MMKYVGQIFNTKVRNSTGKVFTNTIYIFLQILTAHSERYPTLAIFPESPFTVL